VRCFAAGKLGAWHQAVTSDIDSSTSIRAPEHPPEHPPADSDRFAALRRSVAHALRSQAGEIAGRWERQSRDVALRESSDDGEAGYATVAVGLLEVLAASLDSDGAIAEDAVSLGLAYGAEAFERGASLHHTLKGLNLLSAMALYAVECAVAGETAERGSFADGVRLCRRLQGASSFLTLAATKGYTQAVSDGLRDRFRHLRHDLRNPLGTIKSVLALMDDETLPADARSNPRFRVMAERNARSLDELIVARLSDAAALLPALSHQFVSLRTVACGVRRDLRSEAEGRGVTIGISATVVRARVDAVSLELLLRGLLLAALHEAAEGDELIVDFGEPLADRAILILTREPARAPVVERHPLERLTALAARMGAKLETGDRIVVSVPVRRADAGEGVGAAPARDAAVTPTPVKLADGNERYDLGGARQRDHGQAGAE
jgi:signal transduction histidine kinase